MSNGSLAAKAPTTRAFLLAGQSNMVGTAQVDELPPALRIPPANVRFFEDGEERALLWRPRFGPEVGFAHALAAALPEDGIIVCKLARSGANLHYDWNPDGRSRGTEDEYRGPLYPKLVDVIRALRTLPAPTRSPLRICGLVWMQGERDAVFEFMARAYAGNLAAFLAAVRRDTGEATLPCLLGTVTSRVYRLAENRFQHTFQDIVREAQCAVARQDPRVRVVETRDLPQSDNLHYDTTGQILLGRRFADAYLEIEKRATSPTA